MCVVIVWFVAISVEAAYNYKPTAEKNETDVGGLGSEDLRCAWWLMCSSAGSSASLPSIFSSLLLRISDG